MSKNKQLAVLHFFLVFGLVFFNIAISAFVRHNNLFFIPNENPLGFQYGPISSFFLILVIINCLKSFKIFIDYPIISILILAGALSNFLERWVFYNSVADYISSTFSYFNIADVQIWVGLILLNIFVWGFNNKNNTTKLVSAR